MRREPRQQQQRRAVGGARKGSPSRRDSRGGGRRGSTARRPIRRRGAGGRFRPPSRRAAARHGWPCAPSIGERAGPVYDGGVRAAHRAAVAGGGCASAARIVAEVLAAKPDAVLGLPAGNTPGPAYAELTRLCRAGGLSFARAQTFNLDELPRPSARLPGVVSVLDGGGLPPERRPATPAGPRPRRSGRRSGGSRRAVRGRDCGGGGFDLVLLGIGANGHIAFNEPARRSIRAPASSP